MGNIILLILKEILEKVKLETNNYKDFYITKKIRTILRNYFYTFLYYNKTGGKARHEEQEKQEKKSSEFFGIHECQRKANHITNAVSLHSNSVPDYMIKRELVSFEANNRNNILTQKCDYLLLSLPTLFSANL